MADPSKLIAGAMAVYGTEKFNQLYGDIVPIEPSRIIEADDNFVLNFNDRELLFIDTPGHARHHFCIWDKLTESMFTGDTFGLSYREFDTADEVFIFPSTSPVQFDPEELIKSITKLMEYNPKRTCLTHFSALKPTKKTTEQLINGVKFFTKLGRKYTGRSNAEVLIQNEMMNYLLMQLQGIGFKDQDFARQRLQKDVEINTQGLIHWQQKFASDQHK